MMQWLERLHDAVPLVCPGCLLACFPENLHLLLQASPGEWPWEAIVLIGWLVFFRILVGSHRSSRGPAIDV
jgi:hypothetical protein